MATAPTYLTPCQPPPSPVPMLAAVDVWKESVAESCSWPMSEAVVDGSGSGSDDEDGCESCVDGGAGKEDEEESEVVWPWSQGGGGRRKDEKGISEVVWSWSQDGGGGVCFIWPPSTSSKETTTTGCGHAGAGSDDDLTAVAAAAAQRQEEDRKFWEVCLSTGYP